MMINNFEDWWSEIGSQPPLGGHDIEEHTKTIAEMAWNQGKPIDWFNDAFVIVVENDSAARGPLKSNGPLALETYTGKSNLLEAIEQSKSIGGKYGWSLICRLEIIGSPDECEKILDQESE